jgi:hypothetical protein
VEHARHHDEIGAAAARDLLGEPGIFDVAFAQPDVRQLPARDPRAAAGEPSGAAIDGDDALVVVEIPTPRADFEVVRPATPR